MPVPQKKLIPGILLLLMLATVAAPPLWWSDGDPPVIVPGAPQNNHGPANIGQAKHMAKSALDALRPILPLVADQIEADLTLERPNPEDPANPLPPILTLQVPNPKPAGWAEKQKAPLLIGQLKAIADPFYTRIHAAAPAWLEAERIANGTFHLGSIFPWSAETTDDNNKGIANIGQLKAVFSLRFEALTTFDSDDDGMSDIWEIANGLDPSNPADAYADPDGDDITNKQEKELETDPNSFDQIGPVNIGFSKEITDSPDLSFRPENPSDLYPEESVPHWRAAIGQHIEIWDEGDGNPYAELQSHWDAKGIEQEFDMLPGTSLTLILRYKGRYDGYSDSNPFTLKIEGAHELLVNGQPAQTQESVKQKSFMTDDVWQKYAEWQHVSVVIIADPQATTLVPVTLTLIPEDTNEAITYGGFVDLFAVEVDYIGRDPDTGEFHNLGGMVDSSDPRPAVDLETATATINNNGSLDIEISGAARDYMSELFEDNTGSVTSIQVFIDGDLVDTIANLPAANAGAHILDPWLKRDSTVSFSKTITVPEITPGLHNLVVKSNANALGKQGWDGVSILVEKQNYSDVPLANAPAFSVLLNGSLGSARDSITLQSGATNAILTEPEGMEESGVFVGQMTHDDVAREIQVELAPTLNLNENQRDDLGGEIMWQDSAGGMNLLQAIWKETTATSKLFSATSTLATVESWSNLQVTSVTHQPNPPGRGMNPFVVRFQAPEGIEIFGENGILRAKRNGEEVEFKEHEGILGEDPPEGMEWYFLHVGDEPQVFCLNDELAGSIHSPVQVLDDGQLRLKFLLKNDESIILEDKSTVSALYDIPEIAGVSPLDPSALPAAMAAATGGNFTMDDVRFWFEILFEDAGKNLLDHYESGNGNDSGLNISLGKLWVIDNFWSSKRLYKFDGIRPSNMNGGFDAKPATLRLNRFKIKSPIDGAVALFTALQELRGKDNLWLRTGLEINWTDILDDYADGELADENVEQALRQARLAPIAGTVSFAKSSYELGFSLVPLGGDLIVSVNDIDTALADGDKTAVAVAVGAILVPEILERTIKYAKRTSRTVKWDFKAEGVMDWTVEELEILYEAGVGKNISRIKKMDSLRPYIESGELVLDDNKIKALRSNLKLEPPEPGIDLGISGDNSRAVLRRQLKMPPNSGLVAHHDLPICAKEPDLEKEFLKRGIDPNKAEHGRPLEPEKHLLIHGKGTSGWPFGDPFIHQWDIFFKRTPDAKLEDIRTLRDQLREITSQPFSNADELPWIYSKTDQ